MCSTAQERRRRKQCFCSLSNSEKGLGWLNMGSGRRARAGAVTKSRNLPLARLRGCDAAWAVKPHPSQERWFPRQVSSERLNIGDKLSDDTKQINTILLGQERGRQKQNPGHPLFLLRQSDGEVLLSRKHLQNLLLKTSTPRDLLRSSLLVFFPYWGSNKAVPLTAQHCHGAKHSVLCQGHSSDLPMCS